MERYTLNKHIKDGVIRDLNGTITAIPHDPRNADWKRYQKWLAKGNTPDPYVEPTPPTDDEILDKLLDIRLIVRAMNDVLHQDVLGYTKTKLKNRVKALRKS